MVEGLYEDCDGRIYAMDTGVDDSSSDGNRLLRFTGDVLGGDFSFAVVSDLSTASVADIDDMGPGIDNNAITDNPGLAIDTGHIHARSTTGQLPRIVACRRGRGMALDAEIYLLDDDACVCRITKQVVQEADSSGHEAE